MKVGSSKTVRYIAGCVGGLLFVSAAWLLAVTTLPPRILYWDKVRQVETYVQQIEKYRVDHGRYPEESEQDIVPRDESGSSFFYKGGGAGYEVGFSIGFDEEYTFSSADGKWSFERAEP